MKKVLITWITWQDGSYLAELLLEKWYEVHGIKRRTSLINTDRIDHIFQDPHEDNKKFFLHYWDTTDSGNMIKLIAYLNGNPNKIIICPNNLTKIFNEKYYPKWWIKFN